MKLDERSVALPTVYRYTGSKSLNMGELFLTWLIRDIYKTVTILLEEEERGS